MTLTPRPGSRASGLALAAALAIAPLSSAAQPAPSKEVCANAYVDGQTLRKDGKLGAARERLLVCAQQACPAALNGDCARWVTEVTQAMPSVVFAVKGADGNDTTAVRVHLDGQLVRELLDGRPIELDPGSHHVRLEHGSERPIELDIVVQQGIKNRLVTASFAKVVPPPVGPPPPPIGARPTEPPEEDRGELVAGLVVGGVGLAGIGVGIGFGVVGKKQADALKEGDGCGVTMTCQNEDIEPVEDKLLAADISFIAGGVTAAVGAGLLLHYFLSEPDAPNGTGARLELRPTPGGAHGGVAIPF